jgi:hypothetical protein
MGCAASASPTTVKHCLMPLTGRYATSKDYKLMWVGLTNLLDKVKEGMAQSQVNKPAGADDEVDVDDTMHDATEGPLGEESDAEDYAL